MQKALRINLLARNSELKKTRRKLFEKRKDDEVNYQRVASLRGKELRDQRRTERRERREDWINGDLAANRNTGLNKGSLGTVGPMMTSSRPVPEYVIAKHKTGGYEYEGVGNEWNIIVGDRVCVVRGVAGTVGHIGMVKEVNPEKGELTVADVNIADVKAPEYLPPEQRKNKVNSIEIPLKFADVRLVVIRDDDDGKRDVIVRHIRGGAPYYDREYGSNVPRHTRYIAGDDLELVWPTAEIQEREREAYDTSSRDMEDDTYMPSVLQPPMPKGAEKELARPKDGMKHQYDTEWMTRKILEDARSAWYEQRRMLTPKSLAMEKTAQEKRVKGIEMARAGIKSAITREQSRQMGQRQHGV